MFTIITKAVLHLAVLLILSLLSLWILFFFHGTGLNSLLIPDQLRWRNRAESEYIIVWYLLSCAISYIELFGLLWLINQFNYWYGQDWLKPTQLGVAKITTAIVGVVLALCVALYYISSYTATH